MPYLTALQAVILFALWTLAVLALGIGTYRWSMILAGKARINAWPGDQPHGPPIYRRIARAHANCLENLPVFAAIILCSEVSGHGSAIFDRAATVVLVARICQTLAHVFSGSETAVAVRFGFFSIQLVAMVLMAGLALVVGT